MQVPKKTPRNRIPVRMLPVGKLLPTPDNKRRSITRASVESLAKSMTRDGVIQPIVVREHPEKAGHWEIRAGERRWRAATLAGLAEMPAIVRTLDDESALSVTIAENLQRQDLHPLEEAATIQQAFDRGYDVKAVAARLGKSVPYIARRASLTRLSKVWREEVLKPNSDAARLSVAHLELVARLPAETQDALAENSFHRVFARGFPTVEELRRLIDGGLRTLKAMPWPLGDETIDPKAGACLSCPKRSGMHPVLFDAEDAPQNGKVSKTDRCLDPACFDRKQAVFLERRESELKAEHPTLRLVQLGFDRLATTVREKFGDRVTHVYHPKIVKPSNPAATPAMQIDGPKAGTLVHLDLGESVVNTSHGAGRKQVKATGPDGKPVPMSLEERKARLQKRRDAFLVRQVHEAIVPLAPHSLADAVSKMRARKGKAGRTFDPLALVLAFGTSTRTDREHDDSPWKRYEHLRARRDAVPLVTALHEVVQVWTRRLGGMDPRHVTQQAADARRIATLLGLDIEQFEKAAKATIPTPKSWNEPVDGGVVAEPTSGITPPNGRLPAANGSSAKSRGYKRP